jgi:hypothetical protein
MLHRTNGTHQITVLAAASFGIVEPGKPKPTTVLAAIQIIYD